MKSLSVVTVLMCLALLHPCQTKAQEVTYKPTKASIKQHPTPNWFKEVKFGVFIHFFPSGVDAPIPEKFSADQWIDLFEKAGAEYFVFTTKHNNGWCNWPSKISEHSAKEVNGPRDLVTPLVASARKAGMKVGLYYNLMDRYEGVHKEISKDPDREPPEEYVLNFMHPQIKELVSTYQPDLLWTDGDWISTSPYWYANEIVAWLYNWAEKEGREICLTDRWGKDIRICSVDTTPEKYGDFWTLELRVMGDVVTTHPWESCQTLFNGWWYREKESFRASVPEVISVLCDIVSKGGRLLLNIGPKPDGSMSDADRETLLGLGKWLEVNGEAIYGAKPIRVARSTSSENELDRARNLLVPDRWFIGHEQSWQLFAKVNQEQGPIRFTTKGSYTYAIHQGWPGEELELNDLAVKPDSEIRMLGVKEPLSWKSQGNKTIIKLPAVRPCEHAFVLKMEIE